MFNVDLEKFRTREISLSEIKSAWISGIRSGTDTIGGGTSCATRFLQGGVNDNQDSFVGSSSREILDTVENGYRPNGLSVKAKRLPTKDRKRRVYSEQDGTLDVNRALAGEQTFYVKKVKREIKPGITLNMRMDFSAHVPAEVITQYGLFVARLANAIESQGIDIAINVEALGRAMITTEEYTRVLINVKSRGTRSRFHSWSCLLAPGGYRSLVFSAMHMVAAKTDERVCSTLGYPMGKRKWELDYDKKSNTVTVYCDSQAHDFPEADMMAQAKAAGLV